MSFINAIFLIFGLAFSLYGVSVVIAVFYRRAVAKIDSGDAFFGLVGAAIFLVVGAVITVGNIPLVFPGV